MGDLCPKCGKDNLTYQGYTILSEKKNYVMYNNADIFGRNDSHFSVGVDLYKVHYRCTCGYEVDRETNTKPRDDLDNRLAQYRAEAHGRYLSLSKDSQKVYQIERCNRKIEETQKKIVPIAEEYRCKYVLYIVWLILSIVELLLCISLCVVEADEENGVLVSVVVGLIFAGGMIFKTIQINKKATELKNQKNKLEDEVNADSKIKEELLSELGNRDETSDEYKTCIKEIHEKRLDDYEYDFS